jgi:hypothetical protein
MMMIGNDDEHDDANELIVIVGRHEREEREDNTDRQTDR